VKAEGWTLEDDLPLERRVPRAQHRAHDRDQHGDLHAEDPQKLPRPLVVEAIDLPLDPVDPLVEPLFEAREPLDVEHAACRDEKPRGRRFLRRGRRFCATQSTGTGLTSARTSGGGPT